MADSAFHVISKEEENPVFRHNRIFKHTYMYKQPILPKWWNYNNFLQISYSYLKYTDWFSHVFFLLLPVTISELHEKPRRKD